MSLWRQLSRGLRVLTRRSAADQDLDRGSAALPRRGHRRARGARALPGRCAARGAHRGRQRHGGPGTGAGFRMGERSRHAARRRALRRTHAAEEPGLHRRGRPRDLARQRRGHDDLQRHERARAPAAAGGRRSRCAGGAAARPAPTGPPPSRARTRTTPTCAIARTRSTASAAWGRVSLTIATGGEGTAVLGHMVSGNYFDVLGVRPALGRFFAADENRTPGSHPVIVVSHAFWKSRLGGDPLGHRTDRVSSTAIRSRSSASRRNRSAASTPACRPTHGSR